MDTLEDSAPRAPAPGAAKAWLAPVAIAGQLLVAGLTGLLARTLDLGQFEVYAVTSALFVTMVTMAPLGADKLALLVLSPALAAGDGDRAAALLRFALRRTLAGTVIFAGVGLGAGFAMAEAVPGLLPALAIAVLSLPAAVVAHLGLEVLTAAGRPLPPALLLRLAVPGTALAVVGAALAVGAGMSASLAIAAWGVGWVLAAIVVGRRLGAIARAGQRSADAARSARWRAAARSLWLHRVAMIVMSQGGIVALAWLGVPAVEVGAYAAATTVVGVGLVLATSTNRAYARPLALLLEARDTAGIASVHWQRLRWLGPAIGIFLLLALVFPAPILARFRPEFAEAGATPLRILAGAAAVSMSLALAPTYLKLRAQNRDLLRTAATCAALQLLLLLLLVPPLGATGAAAAHALATAIHYATLARMARSDLVRRRGPTDG